MVGLICRRRQALGWYRVVLMGLKVVVLGYKLVRLVCKGMHQGKVVPLG